MELNTKLSDRVNAIALSKSMSSNEEVVKLIKQGVDVINLTIGEPDFPSPLSIKKAGIDAIKNNYTHYTNSKGIHELLVTIGNVMRKKYSTVIDPDKNIIITPGTKQAVYYLNCVLINPGDEGIIFEPNWLTYWDSLKLCGGIPVNVIGKESDGFKPKIRDINNSITKKTKYILFSNPCNPTGAVWNREELRELLKIAITNNILIIADEIYGRIIFDKRKFVSIGSLENVENNVIILNGFSKEQAMTGWRIGYMIGPAVIIDAVNKMQQQIATRVSSISQHAALKGFSVERSIDNMVRTFEKRRNILIRGLNKIKGFSCQKPQGTFYAFVNISGTGMDSEQIADYLLQKAKIGVVPGVSYGSNFRHYIRVSFTINEKRIIEALNRLTELFGKK